MKRNLTLLFSILLYSCGDDSTTSSPSIDFYSNDQIFINDLAAVNGISDSEIINDRITTIGIDSSGVTLYKIRKLYLSSMNLDSLPQSIGELDSLNVLMLNDNNLQYLTESICTIYDQLDSMSYYNNYVCTPTLPSCIQENTTIPNFYSNQKCNIWPDEYDVRFIEDVVNENWPETTAGFIDSLKNYFTEWEECIEGDAIVNRIIEIRFIGKGINTIPQSIGELDSLRYLALENNHIDIIPNTIGNLEKLVHFTIDRNDITYIPPLIKNLSNLAKFNISDNKLGTSDNNPGTIEENIGELSKLNELDLSNNQLTSLPESMCIILNNPGITIFIDNNFLCPINSNSCFNDLIGDSVQPDSFCD